MDSILDSIKKVLGISPEYTQFDADLVLDINTALTILTQMGIGPTAGFLISDNSATWEDFIGTDKRLELVKTYIQLKVKILFDTQAISNSTVMEAYNNMLNELEYRLSVTRDEIDEEGKA